MKHRFKDSGSKLVKKDSQQEEHYKLSIHSSSNFHNTDHSGSKRQNMSRVLQNSRKKILMRKASQLFSSGVRSKSSKINKRNQLIEFDNIKWISIISAYDPSRLKNVSVSKKTCQKFLEKQGSNIKNDPRSQLYFNDLIKNFKSWLNKIHMQYFYIMEKFLYDKQSVNTTLTELRPKLNQVINQTLHMQQNLQDCLKSHQNNEFRQLLKKYYVWLQNSRQIEEIITVVNKSKSRIDNLFHRFQEDTKIQQKINRVKLQGIKQVRKIVSDYKQVGLQNKIMDRIQMAINQMAQKSGQAYRKIKGVKQLIQKFKNTKNRSEQVINKVDMESINLMGKVCKQICYEAEAFEAFSLKFLNQGDIINDDLKKIIRKYQQDVIWQRKRAIELQVKFLNIIFSQAIKKLKQNSKIVVAYKKSQQNEQEYRLILRMVQDIAECLSDPNKKIKLQKLAKQTNIIFDRLYEQLKYLKQNKRFIEIDTQQGLISVLGIGKLMKQYKQKILMIRKKFQICQREIGLHPIRIQQVSLDQESQFIGKVISLSKKINNSNLRQNLVNFQCFSSINHTGLAKMSQQLEKQETLDQITSFSTQYLNLQGENILQQIFGPLELQNLLFKQSVILVQLKDVSFDTEEKNLLPRLSLIIRKRNQWIEKHKIISIQMKNFIQRILANTLVKGLKPGQVKQIDGPRSLAFPTKNTQIQTLKSKTKYRKVILDLIQGSNASNFIKGKLIESSNNANNPNKPQKANSNNYSFHISMMLQKNIVNMNNYLEAFNQISEIRRNLNSQIFIPKQLILQFCQKLFTLVFLRSKVKTQNKVTELMDQFIDICGNRFLNLTRKSLQTQNDWIAKQTYQTQYEGNRLPLYLQKIIQTIAFYKDKVSSLLQSCRQINDEYKTSYRDTQSSVQQVSEYLKLSLYGKVILNMVGYCRATQQIVHVILSNEKSPIALINPKQNVLKQIFNGIKKGKQISAKQMQKVVLKVAKIGIQMERKGKSTAKDAQKGKIAKQPDSKLLQMQQQISDQSQNDPDYQKQDIIQDSMDDMNQNYPQQEQNMMDQDIFEQPEQEMIQQFQQPQQQIADDIIEQDKIQQQNLQELLDQSQVVGKVKANKNKLKDDTKKNRNDNFDQYQYEQSGLSKQKKMQRQGQNTKQMVRQPSGEQMLQKGQNISQRGEEQKQKQISSKKQHILVSKTEPPKKVIQNSIYQILQFISSLFQLKKLIGYIRQFPGNYIKNQINWSKVQMYYNSHYSTSLSPNLKYSQQQIQAYMAQIPQGVITKIKKDYQSQASISKEVLNMQPIQSLKKNILLLGNANWQILQRMLVQNDISYNVLMNPNGKSNLYIHIQSLDDVKGDYGSIEGYLSKCFQLYKQDQFDTKSYVEKCFTTKTIQCQDSMSKAIVYEVKDQKSLILDPNLNQSNYQKLVDNIQSFSNASKDIINKLDLCLQMYLKALNIIQKIQIDMKWYSQQIKFLQKHGNDDKLVLYYVKPIRDNVSTVIKKIKSLEAKLQNIIYKCSKDTIFQCFNQLITIYGQQVLGKLVLNRENAKLTLFIFDSFNMKQNCGKIKAILNSEPRQTEQKAVKIVIQLLFADPSMNNLQTTQIQEAKILTNSQKIDTKQNQMLLLQILTLFRINYCYIYLDETKCFKFLTINKTKDECISTFLKKIITRLIQNKQITNKITSNIYLQPLLTLVNSNQNQTYINTFLPSSLKSLFKQNVTAYQIQIIVNEQIFGLNDQKWKDQNYKIVKDLSQCVDDQHRQMMKFASQIPKLKICKSIYEKYLNNGKTSQNNKLWQAFLSDFQKLALNTRQLLNKSHWLLAINSIHKELHDRTLQSLDKNIIAIKSLLAPPKTNQFPQLQKQVTWVFQWIRTLAQTEDKNKLFVLAPTHMKSILYFEFNIQSVTVQKLLDVFNCIQPKNNQLIQYLFDFLFRSLSQQESETQKQKYELSRKDVLYKVDTLNLSKLLLQQVQSIRDVSNKTGRQKSIRQFVRVFNRVYFTSKTTQNIKYKQQVDNLLKLQDQIKISIKRLYNIFIFRNFLQNYHQIFKGNQSVQKYNKIFQKDLRSNEISEEQIPQALGSLQRIKILRNEKGIKSYQDFYSWFTHTIIGIFRLPFYKVILPGVKSQSKQMEDQLLAVVLTQKPCVPGNTDEQLQKYLKQMFIMTQHLPIYLKSDQLIVQLKKVIAFVGLSHSMKQIQLKQILDFLNGNRQSQRDEDSNEHEVLCLRVDHIQQKIVSKNDVQKRLSKKQLYKKGSRNNQQQERNFLQLIPLTNFLTSPQQQFNIHIDQHNLSVSMQFNVVYGPQKFQENLSSNQYVPLNGTRIDRFNNVYMGKQIKLNNIEEWLYSYYQKEKKDRMQVTEREMQLQVFYEGFVERLLGTVLQEDNVIIRKIFNKSHQAQILKGQPQKPKQQLFLPSSLYLIESCNNQLNKYTEQQSQQREQPLTNHNNQIQKLVQNLANYLHGQLLTVEAQIKVNLISKMISLTRKQIRQVIRYQEIDQQAQTNRFEQNLINEQNQLQGQNAKLEQLPHGKFQNCLYKLLIEQFGQLTQEKYNKMSVDVTNQFSPQGKQEQCSQIYSQLLKQTIQIIDSDQYDQFPGQTKQKYESKLMFLYYTLKENQESYIRLLVSHVD